MDCGAGSSLFPLHRCKTLHLVRHAEGIHNVEGDKDFNAFLSPELFDAYLTPLGWNQVDNLRKHVNACGLAKKIELVITSPLLRTMQTAVGVFGGDSIMDGVNVPPLMVENAGNCCRSAISCLNCPPIIAVEYCREHMGVYPCDRRRSISEYQLLFPAIDFSLIENDEDVLWKSDVREPDDDLVARGMKFINWLWTRKEKEIAVVTHGGFLFHTLQHFGKGCHPIIIDEMSKQWKDEESRKDGKETHLPQVLRFANCELRSMVLIDRSVRGTDPPVSNYPGNIPNGPDLPSDVADEKFLDDKTIVN